MNTRRLELVAGLFLLAGLVAVTALAVHLGGTPAFARGGTEYQALFASASGLKEGSRVEIAGVRVGEVRRLELRPEDFRAVVTFRIPAGIALDDDTIAAVRSNGLLGDRSLVLRPGGSGIPLEPGALIVDTESAVDLESVISRIAFGGVGAPASP